MTAFCGVAAGLSVALMLAGGVIPVATYVTPILASVLLIPVRIEFSGKAALATWAVTAAISLILGLDKEAVFFYIFVCWWPIAKWPVELHVHRKGVRLLLKTMVFALSVSLMYTVLTLIMPLNAIVAEFREMGVWLTAVLLAALVLCLLIYDRMLVPFSFLYVQRIRPRLIFLRHG